MLLETIPMLLNVLIIGGGPASYTAAIYTARAQLNPVVIEGTMPGGQLMGTTYVENWPGNTSILGPDLMMNMREHAEHCGTQFIEDEVIEVDCAERPFTVKTARGKVFKTKTLIIATGAKHNRLNCPGEQEYWGKGVTVCAVCDGALYREKKVFVVGGGDSGMEDALFLTKFTKDVTVLHIHEKLSASRAMQDKVLNNQHIKIKYSSTITAIHGDGNHVTAVTITDKTTNTSEEFKADGVFIAIGLKPATQLFKGKLELLPTGHIKTFNHTSETSIPGIFAAGDVADARYRQAITSAGTGCMAALDAERYLEKNDELE
jgi:thioredoxin reductase (NADPH)